VFSLMSGVAAMAYGFLPRRLPIRFAMAFTGVLLALGTWLMLAGGYLAAALFGLGVGGVLTLLPIAWADYFGRANFGAIRGLALSAQVLAQAAGPLLSGALRDLTADYRVSLYCFAGLSLLSVAAALAARRPTAAGGLS
jgi:cyanate permease